VHQVTEQPCLCAKRNHPARRPHTLMSQHQRARTVSDRRFPVPLFPHPPSHVHTDGDDEWGVAPAAGCGRGLRRRWPRTRTPRRAWTPSPSPWPTRAAPLAPWPPWPARPRVAPAPATARAAAGGCAERGSDDKVANRDGRGFGWEVAHEAVSRRPPVCLYTMVPRTGGYAYDVGVWDLSIVQGPFSVAPCRTLFATFASL
jgi:hypothetical protein